MTDAPSSRLVPDWPAPPNVRAVVTTRDGPPFSELSPRAFNVGTHCGDDPAAVAQNRAFLREALSLPSEPCWLNQVHGTRVVQFDPPLPRGIRPLSRAQSARLPPPVGKGRGGGGDRGEPHADAAVTRAPGVVLAIQTADCLPVLFCAGDGLEIAAAHAGWRGLSAGVLENALYAMRTPRANILAWLGPAIAAQSYEVGDEVRNAFLAHDSTAASAFSVTRPGHWLCDLYALAGQRLRAAGVAQIFDCGLDTFTDPRLHSYRRDGAYSGRMATLIWLAP